MRTNGSLIWSWLAATVVAHLAVSVVHGAAHQGAAVPLSPAATLFVFVVILAGPLVGLGVSWWAERAGGWILAATLGGSLLFGLVNHFAMAGPDQVSHVDAAWRPLFGATALLLAVTAALGVWLAVRLLRSRRALA